MAKRGGKSRKSRAGAGAAAVRAEIGAPRAAAPVSAAVGGDASRAAPMPKWAPHALAAALLVAALVPAGPLAFVPPTARWPAVAAAVLALVAPNVFARGGRAAVALEAVAVVAVVATYALLKCVGIHASWTDDNIYFYLASRVAAGAVPYRDFFFAHPPVHLLVPALVFRVFGFSIPVAKSIPAIASGLAALLVWGAARARSRSFALAVLALHLSTYEILMGSTDMNGENLLCAFVAAALFAAVRGWLVLAGALASLALGCGLYALAAVVALAIAAVASSRAAGLRFVGGLAAGLAVVFGGALRAAGDRFVDGAFRYHMAKPLGAGGREPVLGVDDLGARMSAIVHNLGVYLESHELLRSLYFHSATWVGAGVAAVLVVALAARARRVVLADMLAGTPEGFAKLGLLALALFVLQWACVNEVYDFYAVPMLALAALPGAWAFAWSLDLAGGPTGPAWLAARLAALLALGAHPLLASALSTSLFADEATHAGEVVSYVAREPDVTPALAALSRELFFAPTRVKGENEPPYRHYVWNKSLGFSTAGDVAAYVAAHSSPGETIAGASTLAPLVALLADRRIANDEADTNAKRVRAGNTSFDEIVRRACADRVRFLVTAPRSLFDPSALEASPIVRANFVRERTFADPAMQHFKTTPVALYRRVDRDDAALGSACKLP